MMNEKACRNIIVILSIVSALGIGSSIYFGRNAYVTLKSKRELYVAGQKLERDIRRIQDLADERGYIIEDLRRTANERFNIIEQLRAEQSRRDGYIAELERYRDDRSRIDGEIKNVLLDIAARNNLGVSSGGDSDVLYRAGD